MTDEEKIRDFEKNILDKVHLKLEFIKYSDDIVIPFLLQSFGDTVRHREQFEKNGYTESALNTFLTNLLHGIGHCIRWSKRAFPKYDSISNYRLAQQKVKTVAFNESEKTIIFIQPTQLDDSQIPRLQSLHFEQMIAGYSQYPQELIQKEFMQWIEEIKPISPPIANCIKWHRARMSSAYPALLSQINQVILPELPDSADLEGYSLGDLRQFYTLFFLNFSFITWIEDLIDQSRGVGNSYGSNPLYLEKHEFLQLAVTVTGLSSIIVQNIIEDFAFDITNFHSSLSIQPFVQSNSGTYYLLPNLFALMEPSRMVAGAFNKGKKKKVYDRIINQIEKEALKKLIDKMAPLEFTCISDRQIKTNGRQISPDIILVDKKLKSLLVIEYKHFIGPTTASEVIYKINELNKGINQIQAYVRVLSDVNRIELHEIEGYSIYGMIITHKPLSVPIPDTELVHIGDSISFLGFIEKNRNASLLDIYNNFRPSPNPKSPYTPVDETIQVEDWKIVRRIFKRTALQDAQS